MRKVFFLFCLLFFSCDTGVIPYQHEEIANYNHIKTRVALLGQSNASHALVEAIKVAARNNDFYIVGQNWPGQSIRNWWDNGPQNNLLSDYMFLEQFPDPPDYLLWFQGESDRLFPWEDYKIKFQNIRAWYTNKYPGLKFIILEVYTTNTGLDPRGNLWGIRHAQEILAADSPLISIIDTKQFERNPPNDPTHLTAQGREDLAAVIADYIRSK